MNGAMITLFHFYGWLNRAGHETAAADMMEMLLDAEDTPNTGQVVGLIGQVCARYDLDETEVWGYLAS